MNTKYTDLINQTYYFPQEEFKLEKTTYNFTILTMKVKKYGTPLKFTYLPRFQIINKAKGWFRKSMEKNKYEANITIVIALKALI
jgi:arginine decarboxylase